MNPSRRLPGRRHALAALLGSCALLASVALLASCNGRLERFPLTLAGGGSIALRESPAARPDREGMLAPATGGRATPLYTMRRPLAVSATGQAFAVSYTGSLADARLALLGDGRTVLAEVSLPAPPVGGTFRFLVPLRQGDLLRGFQVSTPSTEGSFELLGAGIEPLVRGFSVRGSEIVLDGSVTEVSLSPGRMLARLSRPARDAMAAGPWRITLGADPAAGSPFAGGSITLESASGARARFSVEQGSALAAISFHAGALGFVPRLVRAEGMRAGSLTLAFTPEADPIPADPGLVLAWDRTAWRRPDFEVFSWESAPRVLIVDTADYRVQDRLFKRLAFFVEKAGFAGTIPAWGEIDGLHGYNAHDYRAEDLARFFDTAASTRVELGAEERTLARILLERGVIRETGSGYAPGEGAILSISRSSSPILRELLLTHECFHGLYFTMPGFRAASADAWKALSPVEQETWKRFLASKDYNTVDPDLVVNEFQAYLFQQHRAGVPGFQALTLSRLAARSAADAALVARFRAGFPDSMLASFDRLDPALRAAGGPPGGRAIAVKKLP